MIVVAAQLLCARPLHVGTLWIAHVLSSRKGFGALTTVETCEFSREKP